MAGVLVHEWIEKIGGSENVLEALSHIFPDADMLCLWNNAAERFPDRVVRETALARSPLRGRKAAALPFVPAVWRNQTNHDYDWALVSSHSFAHHVSFKNQPPDFAKLAYVHTPARYIWNPELDSRGDNAFARALAAPFKGLDRRRAIEATSIAVNSQYVAARVKKSWGRDSTVIHPPVEVADIAAVPDWADEVSDGERCTINALPAEFVLGASRFISYKRLDLVIRAGEVSRLPVVIAGGGPEEAALRGRAESATVPVVFVDSPSNALLRALYQRAMVYVFPAVEDFGIMPIEAMAAGTPVVCNSVGGVPESVIDDETGAHVSSWNDRELVNAVSRASALDRTAVAVYAQRFARERFDSNVHEWWAELVGPRG
ncbi:glycosyltransferase [Paramicrobacterium chengjingii]|uniref:glycosyltransferase n=1 Tax=Paramicrobacterium chengjingii TaxID=2769067 RepID=UPI00141F8654|nr:glycosyltransferase [Microbacterium chengjingii]